MFFRENEEPTAADGTSRVSITGSGAAALTGEQVTLVSHVGSVIRRPESLPPPVLLKVGRAARQQPAVV